MCNVDVKFNWDYDLTPVTVVAILNFQFEHDDDWPREKYHSSYRLREDGSNEIMTDVLRFVFLELGRFKNQIYFEFLALVRFRISFSSYIIILQLFTN